jgi:hypothetical protein
MHRRSVLSLFLLPMIAHAGWRRENHDACARIDARLDQIEARRRAGFGAREGRRLQAQREKLEAQRRQLCR